MTRRGIGIFFFLALWAVPAVRAEDMDPLRQEIRKSQAALEELKASREKLENPVQDREALERIKEEISLKEEQLDSALQEVQPKNREEELCFAVVRGDEQEVKRLLEAGANPDGRDRFGGSALEGAADGGFTPIVELLIRKGADVNSRGTLGGTPLILAAGKGHLEVVRLLLESHADVNARAETGVTALRAAKGNGHKQVVELLKKAGAKEQFIVHRDR